MCEESSPFDHKAKEILLPLPTSVMMALALGLPGMLQLSKASLHFTAANQSSAALRRTLRIQDGMIGK